MVVWFLEPWRSSVFEITRKVVTVVIVTWIIHAWSWSYARPFLEKSMLARGKSGSLRIGNGGDAVHTKRINFYTPSVLAWCRCVLLD